MLVGILKRIRSILKLDVELNIPFNSIPIRTYVVTLNMQQFMYWCHENNISPNCKNVIYVSRFDILRGIDGRFANFVFCGQWYLRKDINEIQREVNKIQITFGLQK